MRAYVFHMKHNPHKSHNPQARAWGSECCMGAELPWLRFYPRDWRGDQALRVCSLAARGLWIEMLCVMHEAKPYGHLLINGQPVTNPQLAGLCGVSPDQIATLLAELDNEGAYSRTAKGVIFSRRMTRDAKK